MPPLQYVKSDFSRQYTLLCTLDMANQESFDLILPNKNAHFIQEFLVNLIIIHPKFKDLVACGLQILVVDQGSIHYDIDRN